MNGRKEGQGRRRFLEDLFPRQRPKEEWEHVYVTRNGTRYVDVKELLEDERVKALIRKAATIEVESPPPPQSTLSAPPMASKRETAE